MDVGSNFEMTLPELFWFVFVLYKYLVLQMSTATIRPAPTSDVVEAGDPAEYDPEAAKIRELRVAARKRMRKKDFVAAANFFAEELELHRGEL
jgi:hypothetical protein